MRRASLVAIAVSMAVLLSLHLAPACTAQQTPAATAQSATGSSTSKMVLAETLASLSLGPMALSEGPAMKMAPLEVITAAGLENIGIDPLKLERFDVLLGPPGPTALPMAMVLNSSEPMDVTQLTPDMQLQTFDSLSIFHWGEENAEWMIHQLDDGAVRQRSAKHFNGGW